MLIPNCQCRPIVRTRDVRLPHRWSQFRIHRSRSSARSGSGRTSDLGSIGPACRLFGLRRASSLSSRGSRRGTLVSCNASILLAKDGHRSRGAALAPCSSSSNRICSRSARRAGTGALRSLAAGARRLISSSVPGHDRNPVKRVARARPGGCHNLDAAVAAPESTRRSRVERGRIPDRHRASSRLAAGVDCESRLSAYTRLALISRLHSSPPNLNAEGSVDPDRSSFTLQVRSFPLLAISEANRTLALRRCAGSKSHNF